MPVTNRQLWRELARTVANLTQLQQHVATSPTPQAELALLIEEIDEELSAFRRSLLVPESTPAPAAAPAESAGTEEPS